MSIFSPRCEGSITLDNVPEDFAERMAKRVEEGLLMPGSRKRANYSVRSRDLETIRFGADDRMTAFNIALNEATVPRPNASTLHYDFEYRRWARYVLYLSLAIVAPMALVPFIPAVHNAFSEYSAAPYMYWGMLLFWGVVWPWLLAVLHHRFAARVPRAHPRRGLRRCGRPRRYTL